MNSDNYERQAQEVLDHILELTHGLPNNVRDAVLEMLKVYCKTYRPEIPKAIGLLIAPE
jgi:hypothetical protein